MKWPIYTLFAVMPLAQTTVFGHVLLLEVVLLMVIFSNLMSGNAGGAPQRILFLDVMVAIYALFSLASVAAGAHDLYNSMRYYRWDVLAPVIIYFVLRKANLSAVSTKNGLFFLVPGILMQAGMFIHFYITTGERPEGVKGIMFSAITLSFIFVMGAWITLFLRKHVSTKVMYFVVLAVCGILVMAVTVSFTRMAIIPFILFTPIIHQLWTRRKLRKLASHLFVASLAAYISLIMASAVVFQDIGIEDRTKVQGSIERIYNIDLYIRDITGRMAFQGQLAREALEHPVLGLGGADYYYEELGTAHNVLVSSLIVGGVPGLAIFLLLIAGTYKALNSTTNESELVTSLGKILWCSFTMLMLIAITNDVSGARMLYVFFLMGLVANLSLIKDIDKKKMVVQKKKGEPRILYTKR